MNPLKPHQILRQNQASRLYPGEANRIVVEEPKPISQSFEWRIASRYWKKHGVGPFSDGSVPYIINNSGWAPRAAAELILASGQAQKGQIIVIEIAAGSGIFARQALDHIKAQCEDKTLDVYDRLLWICTDGSEESVQSWQSRGQFLDHQNHIRLAKANAEELDQLELPDGSVIGVIANYALDSLPAEVVRKDGGRMHLQACVYGEEFELEQWVGIPLSEIRHRIEHGAPEDLDDLLPLLDCLEMQASFLPGDIPYAQEALESAQSDVAMVNVGTIRFLEHTLSFLTEGGFILINDYGPTTQQAFDLHTFIHRFGGTVTCALNFPHLRHWLEARGCRVIQPKGDEHRTIHTRLAILGGSKTLEQAFDTWFNDPSYVNADRVGAWINSYVASGQLSEALDMFERHLKWCPTDWHKLCEAAQLLMQQFGQMPEALELAKRACELNPWSSTLVWNVYGSVLYSMGMFEDAEQAWSKAIQIFPRDPSTWLNLAYLYSAQRQTEHALNAIAKGLTYDQNGALRAALLQKQTEILSDQFQFKTAQADRLTRRHRTLTDAIRPPSPLNETSD